MTAFSVQPVSPRSRPVREMVAIGVVAVCLGIAGWVGPQATSEEEAQAAETVPSIGVAVSAVRSNSEILDHGTRVGIAAGGARPLSRPIQGGPRPEPDHRTDASGGGGWLRAKGWSVSGGPGPMAPAPRIERSAP